MVFHEETESRSSAPHSTLAPIAHRFAVLESYGTFLSILAFFGKFLSVYNNFF